MAALSPETYALRRLADMEARMAYLTSSFESTPDASGTDTVLDRPEAIYEIALKYFPTAKAQVIQSEPARLVVTLSPESPDIPILTLIYAVVQKSFENLLRRLQISKTEATICRTAIKRIEVNTADFSVTGTLLREYKLFGRKLYEQRGKKCSQALREYLKEASTTIIPDEIRNLGLAPDQLLRSLDDADVALFAEVFKDLEPTDPIFANFRVKYRGIAVSLAKRIEERKLAAPKVDKYGEIVRSLQAKVVGQKFAIELVAGALAGSKPESKTGSNHVFLFVGPTGVGKTELAKAASSLKDGRLISFNMEKYRAGHTSSAFWGSPSGYVGSTAKPAIAVELEKYPAALKRKNPTHIQVEGIVLLFDEFEKAHPSVQQSFLSLLDEGYCECEYTGKEKEDSGIGAYKQIKIKYELRNCIIIATSNAHQEVVLSDLAAKKSLEVIADNFKRLCAAHYVSGERGFAPELLARFSPIIPFGAIPRGEEFRKAIQIHLNAFLSKVKNGIGCKEVCILSTEELSALLEERLYGSGIDLRRIKIYLDGLLSKLQKYVYLWGEVKNIKLIFSALEGQVYVEVNTFSPLIDGYIPTPGTERIRL